LPTEVQLILASLHGLEQTREKFKLCELARERGIYSVCRPG